MNERQQQLILESLIKDLELPDSAYETAKKRYENLGEWLGREDSTCANHDVHVFPQGSFRLGTAIKPLHSREEYDLDITCVLRQGVTVSNITQEDLKKLVGAELEAYRTAVGVKSPLEEKRRCWRLEYADDLSFHMDIVPCIADSEKSRRLISESMINSGVEADLATSVASLAVRITDNEDSKYDELTYDWRASNPEGYAKWFENKMSSGANRVRLLEKAQVDDLPIYRRKTSLQRCIQILKRHRDQMFQKHLDSKPVSIIISTIAARSYSGQPSLIATLNEILAGLTGFVESNSGEVLNPVNPAENFADKWPEEQYLHLSLKYNFHLWVHQLTVDFEHILHSTNVSRIVETASEKFAIRIPEINLKKIFGKTFVPTTQVKPQKDIHKVDGKPWHEKSRRE